MFEFVDLGRMSFEGALARQEAAVLSIREGKAPQRIHLVEHPPVFTLGRAGSSRHLLARRDHHGAPIQVVRVSRGGDITFHGPGQLVVYPHLDLKRRGRNVTRYLRDLEECLIRLAAVFAVEARRREGATGVWTSDGKLASIGIGVRRWVTLHGFALNVATDLEYFSLIDPCGIPGCRMTSLERLLGRPVAMEKVKQAFVRVFQETFAPLPQSSVSG